MEGGVLVVDNGAYEARFGISGASDPSLIMPNCTAHARHDPREIVADEVLRVRDASQLKYTSPFDRGYLVNPAPLTRVWERAFADEGLSPAGDFEPSSSVSGILVTEAPFAPISLQDNLTEIIFETFQFKRCQRATAAALSAFGYGAENPESGFAASPCSLVIDSGHSVTHAMPVVGRSEWIRDATRRVDVGGKLLTNLLKEITSYRHWNMMDETKLMRKAFHDLCYVSMDFRSDLSKRRGDEICRTRSGGSTCCPTSGHGGQVVLRPTRIRAAAAAGILRAEQLLMINNERFVVPEVLFRPSDIGIDQGGIHEAAEAVRVELSRDDVRQRALYGRQRKHSWLPRATATRFERSGSRRLRGERVPSFQSCAERVARRLAFCRVLRYI